MKIQYLFTTHSFTEGDKPTNSRLCLLQWNVFKFAVWKWNKLWKKCRKITLPLHPGFSTVCLNQWVLQAAYFNYCQQYGTEGLSPSVNE